MDDRGRRGHAGERTHANMQPYVHIWTNIDHLCVFNVCLCVFKSVTSYTIVRENSSEIFETILV